MIKRTNYLPIVFYDSDIIIYFARHMTFSDRTDNDNPPPVPHTSDTGHAGIFYRRNLFSYSIINIYVNGSMDYGLDHDGC